MRNGNDSIAAYPRGTCSTRRSACTPAVREKGVNPALGGIATLILCIGLTGAPAVRAAEGATPQLSAETSVTSAGTAVEVNLSALPQQSAAAAAAVPPPPRPRGGLSEAEYQSSKAAAASHAVAGPAAPVAETRSDGAGRQTPGASTVFLGQSQGGYVPSDMALAVSETWVVQAVNSSIAVYSKTGAVQAGFPKALGGAGGFFAGATADIGDPRAFYDRSSKRFVVVADDFTGGVLWLAASTTADPRGTWYVYGLAPWGSASCRDTTKPCPDFPMLGFDDQTIYLGLNWFPLGSPPTNWTLLLPKARIYKGLGFSYNQFVNLSYGGVLLDTLHPVTLLGGAEHPRAGFLLASFNINFGGTQCRTGCNGLVLIGLSNTLVVAGSPGYEWSGVVIPTANTYFFPANANQFGSPFSVDTGDVRIGGNPVYHAGLISAALNTNGSDGRAHHLWFQVRPFLNDNNPRCTGAYANKCPQVTAAELVNEDCYFCGGGFNTNGSSFYATIVPDNGGNLTMVFNLSDDNTYPGTAYASRRVTQGKNLMHDAGIYMCGGSSANLSGRMGDYTAAVGDITSANANTMWFSGMHMAGSNAWSSCIGKNGFTSAVNVP